MAVELHDVPSERLPLGADRLDPHDLAHRTVQRGAIRVDDRHEIAKAEMRSGHCGLPYLTFVQLAVAQQGERQIVSATDTCR